MRDPVHVAGVVILALFVVGIIFAIKIAAP
jgi:hypothetical protein